MRDTRPFHDVKNLTTKKKNREEEEKSISRHESPTKPTNRGLHSFSGYNPKHIPDSIGDRRIYAP